MKLWSDYEGRTIAEAYPLKKLVRPEGRSAFFLTTNGTGTPALVRVIEAHFDESEILTRWKVVSEIGQENLVTMRKFGETELDGTPLVYAVMEPTEISLDELLRNRTLTAEETRELAHSLVAALQALHKRDLIHGQIEPENILAVGETVKLRSDCVREIVTYPDSDGPTLGELKNQDAQAVAVVLLQALTGRTSLQGSATLLPSPFDGIIRNGLSGRWGLAEMSAALGPVSPRQAAEAAAKSAAQAAAAAKAAAEAAEAKNVAAKAEAPAANKIEPAASPKADAAQAAIPAAKAEAKVPTQVNLFAGSAAAAQPVRPAGASSTPAASSTSAKFVAESLVAEHKTVTPTQTPDVRHRIVKPVEDEDSKRNRMWIAVAAVVLLVLFFGWRMMRSGPAASATGVGSGAARPVSTLGDPDASTKDAVPVPAAVSVPDKPSATRSANGKVSAVRPPQTAVARPSQPDVPVVSGGAGAKTQWRVVAFTYNHQDQAQHKAETIQQQHPSLNAEVFSPNGRAPYLVTVGGPMSREDAQAFKAKARGQGLPRDLYAQNYTR